MLPAGDSSGWHWRAQREYITGSQHPARTHEFRHTYSSAGDVKETYGVLSGTLPLDRHHSLSGAPIAPDPPSRSGGLTQATEILLARQEYDAFGNQQTLRAPNGVCSGRDYDPAYGHLVINEKTLGGPLDPTTGCGARVFNRRIASFDRGLEKPLASTDVQGQPASYAYDGFGRLVSATYADTAHPGQLASLPTLKVTYQLPDDPSLTPYSITITQHLDGPDSSTNLYAQTTTVTDGLGRTIVVISPADPVADGAPFIASGYVAYNAKGDPIRTYEPAFYSGTVAASLADVPVGSSYGSVEYDAFGRAVRTYGIDHVIESNTVFHALSTDVYDAADILPTQHQGTYLTSVQDGHGRGVSATFRIKVGSALETRSVLNQFLPAGELLQSVQRRAGSADVVRWMRYDSLGRRVLNVEPNTSLPFSPDPGAAPDTIHGYRYAYDDNGRIVGYSDARGCGANFFYDTAGRLIAEDRSPCLGTHAAYTSPDLTTGDGTEAFYNYDVADPDTGTAVDARGKRLDIDIALLWGRTASVSSLGSKELYRYDALGQSTGTAIRLQKPGEGAPSLVARYSARWYVQDATFDAAGRPKTSSTGAPFAELSGADGTSERRFSYTKRGLVDKINSSYGVLYAGGVTLADGRPQSFTLGDAAATKRYFTYDAKHRVHDVQTYRGTPQLWSTPSGGYVPPGPSDDPTRPLLLEDMTFTYDEVGSIIRAEDHRLPDDWPASAKPVTRNFEYDDLYRLTRTTYEYPSGTVDAWNSPFAAENTNSSAEQPSPHVSETVRPTEQRYQYDWLGNISQATDDQSAFWDRSTGVRTHGTSTNGPNQVISATNRSLAPSSSRKGDLSASYDASGNLSALIVRRDGPCLPTGSSCWQRFAYDWDEVGNLVRARRWDLRSAPDERTTAQLGSSVPARIPDAELRFGYDDGGGRVLKTDVDKNGVEKHTLYVFDSLELRRTTFSQNEYTLDALTTTVRLRAGPVRAEVIYSTANLPTLSSARQHVFLAFPDHLGSTEFIIDSVTSELVEDVTYQSYGAVETDYRPARWGSYRDQYKFSDKEDEIELGLVYFGARYYSPQLGTWISPDPATIDQLASDINPYAYVHGSPIVGRDPDGRFLFVPFLIAIGVSALVSAASSAAVQYHQTGSINGLDVLGAAATGAVTAAVSGGVGGVVAGALTRALGTSLLATLATNVGAGIASSVAGGGANYALAHATGGGNLNDLGKAMLVAGTTGAMGGFAASTNYGLGNLGNALVASGLTATSGYATAAHVYGQEMNWEHFALTFGSGVAGTFVISQTTAAVQTAMRAPPKDEPPPPPRLVRSDPSTGNLGAGGTVPGNGGGRSDDPYVAKYADGTLVRKSERPGYAQPLPEANGAPHTALRLDANGRLYGAKEFGNGGIHPTRDISFTQPTFPNGTPRPDHLPPPTEHSYIPNPTGGSPIRGAERPLQYPGFKISF